MNDEEQVVTAARRRAAALGHGDAVALRDLLHERFTWTTHRGEVLSRAEYVDRNTGGRTVWRSQDLEVPHVVVIGDTAVLRADAVDVVLADGEPETFRMPMTQVWVRTSDGWRCLAGHAGPRVP